jgi:hypothetical protein
MGCIADGNEQDVMDGKTKVGIIKGRAYPFA